MNIVNSESNELSFAIKARHSIEPKFEYMIYRNWDLESAI